MCVTVADTENGTKAVGHSSAAAMGVQFAHEHGGPVCAPTGSLGGGEDGSLPPHPRAGTFPLTERSSTLIHKQRTWFSFFSLISV